MFCDRQQKRLASCLNERYNAECLRVPLSFCYEGPVIMSDSEDDVPQLSAATLTALQEFYAESGRTGLEQNSKTDKFCVGAVEEDWVQYML